jgi:hypothetical protein
LIVLNLFFKKIHEEKQKNFVNLSCITDVYPDCHAIKTAKMDKNPLGNDLYAIDPDGAGGESLFSAFCDYKTNKKIGITEVCSSIRLK